MDNHRADASAQSPGGGAKEAVGGAPGDTKLQVEGKADQAWPVGLGVGRRRWRGSGSMARIVGNLPVDALEARHRAARGATGARRSRAVWPLAQGRTVLDAAGVPASARRAG